MPGKSFAQNAHGARINVIGSSAVFHSADRVFQPASLAELADQLAASCIHIVSGLAKGEIFSRPSLYFCRENAMALLKERPVKMILRDHDFNSLQIRVFAWRQMHDKPDENHSLPCKSPAPELPLRSPALLPCSIPVAAWFSSWSAQTSAQQPDPLRTSPLL